MSKAESEKAELRAQLNRCMKTLEKWLRKRIVCWSGEKQFKTEPTRVHSTFSSTTTEKTLRRELKNVAQRWRHGKSK